MNLYVNMYIYSLFPLKCVEDMLAARGCSHDTQFQIAVIHY
jgi:hypothetical protein